MWWKVASGVIEGKYDKNSMTVEAVINHRMLRSHQVNKINTYQVGGHWWPFQEQFQENTEDRSQNSMLWGVNSKWRCRESECSILFQWVWLWKEGIWLIRERIQFKCLFYGVVWAFICWCSKIYWGRGEGHKVKMSEWK